MRFSVLIVGFIAAALAGCETGAPTAEGIGFTRASAIGSGGNRVGGRVARAQSGAGHGADRTPAPRFMSGGYRIGASDMLDISVHEVAALSKTVVVSGAGTINFPLIGEIVVAGRTARQVEGQLIKGLGAKYLRNPQVSVMVREYRSQRITVEGAINKPGIFPLRGRITLLQAIAMAQGLNQFANETVVVFRLVNGHRHAARFNIPAVRDGSIRDPHLRGGDLIVAHTSATHKMFNNLLKALPIAGAFALL